MQGLVATSCRAARPSWYGDLGPPWSCCECEWEWGCEWEREWEWDAMRDWGSDAWPALWP